MGTSVCIECESCKYSKSLLEGIGMLYDDLDYLIGIMEPRQKEEVLAKVLEQRIVKENTVLLNLSNKKYFSRNPKGLYTFKA